MKVEYIQSAQDIQAIADKIYYTLLYEADAAYLNSDKEKGKEKGKEKEKDKEKEEAKKKLWKADKTFAECTEQEAIVQYSLIGYTPKGEPVYSLEGITNAYAIPSTINVYDSEGNILESSPDCIPVPEDGIKDYDLAAFEYKVIKIDFPDETK